MKGFARTYLLALAAGGCLCLGAGTASAGTPAIACGSTLTKSTTLTADLLNCPGTALVIGADGITVNLAGHTISGTNAKGSEGIANDGHAGVRILGSGKITDFRLNGVGMRKAPKSVVRGLTIRRIGAGGVEGEPVSAGIAIVDSPASQVTGNDVANDVKAYQSDGADVLNSRGSVVRGNKLSHNAWNGLVLIDSASSRIAGNEFDDNGNNGTEVNGKSDSTSVTSNARRRQQGHRHRGRLRSERPCRRQLRQGQRHRALLLRPARQPDRRRTARRAIGSASSSPAASSAPPTTG